MKPSRIVLASLFLTVSLPALAHSPLQKSDPADGSVGPAPASFTVSFAHPARLTSLQLKTPAGDTQAIRGLSKTPAASHTVAAPKLTPGRYELQFRAVADDGHVMSGEIRFTVTSGAPAAAAR
jgi:methionine-rich copper-binding protein CopC